MPTKYIALYQKLEQITKMIERGLDPKQEKEVGIRLDSTIKAIRRTEKFYDTKQTVFNVILFVFATMVFTFGAIDLIDKYFDDLSIWLLLISRLLKYLCVIVFFSLAFASPITEKILKIKKWCTGVF